MNKIDRSKYLRYTADADGTMFCSVHNRLVNELCDAYDALAADPRLSLVSTAERPVGVDAVRICRLYGSPYATGYHSYSSHTPDGLGGHSESCWLTVAALHAAFPHVAPPDPRIAELAALKARVAELESQIGGSK